MVVTVAHTLQLYTFIELHCIKLNMVAYISRTM